MKEKNRDALSHIGERYRLGLPRMYGENPDVFTGIRAKQTADVIVFDSEDFHHSTGYIEEDLTSHSIKHPDGRECYIEVRDDGSVYALMNSGLKIEIWDGVMMVGV